MSIFFFATYCTLFHNLVPTKKEQYLLLKILLFFMKERLSWAYQSKPFHIKLRYMEDYLLYFLYCSE